MSDCPTTLEKLLFWTLGYGGWLGIALLPMLWSLQVSKSVKTTVTFLIPPAAAILVTGVFYTMYGFAYITNNVTNIMINPVFLKSSVAMVCLSLASVGLYMTQTMEHKLRSDEIVEESELSDDSDLSDLSDESSAYSTDNSQASEASKTSASSRASKTSASSRASKTSASSRSSVSSRTTSTTSTTNSSTSSHPKMWVSAPQDTVEPLDVNTNILRTARPLP